MVGSTMFRRVGNILVNLNNVSNIMLYSKNIEYNLVGKRWTMFLGSGGSNDIIVKEKFTSEEEAAKAFEKVAEELKKTGKLM